jgi:hypothetical protein
MSKKAFLRSNLARIPLFFKQWRLYGFFVAFWNLLLPVSLRLCRRFEHFFAGQKHRAILKYLSKHYLKITAHYAENNDSTFIADSKIDPKSIIWVCWWDGEETMPALVKVCYNSIKKNAGTHPVKLITKNNFQDYISIPEYILEKVNKKVITITHFSNIVRANLLYDYGGIWLDATILTLKNITLETLPFYTLKAPAKNSHSITLSRFAGITNKSAGLHNEASLQISRWSGFLFAGTKGNIIFDYMIKILYAYWKDHDDQIDYLLYDYTIALGYDNIPFMKKMIDNVPCSNVEKYVLEKNMNAEYSEETFAQYCVTPFHKLTWKLKFNSHTNDGKLTIYGHLINSL